MDIIFLIAYLLPFCFLAVFIGNLGKKFVLYLGWGCIAAVPAYLLVTALTAWFPEVITPQVTLSPVFEEFFKALPLVIPLVLARRSSHRDMLIYAMASGIGFSLIENGYLLHSGNLTVPDLVIRSFTTSLMHGCTCGVVGYGVVLIGDLHRKAVPALMLGFFMIAVVIHAFYNLNALFFGTPGMLIDVVLPFLLFMLLLLCYHVDIPTLFRPDPV